MRSARLIDLAGEPIELPTEDEKVAAVVPPFKTEYADLKSWREARNLTIGGSEAAAVLGLHPYLSPLELYALKAGIVEPDNEETEILEWGRRLEGPIVEAYSEKTGRAVKRHGIHIFRHPDYPLSVSLDGEIVGDPRGPGVLEVKTSSAYTERELQEEIPLQYQIQMQHEMGIMGAKWASLAILILPARKLRWQDLERNDDFIELLFRKELKFIEAVEKKIPPAADGTDSATSAINKLYPRDSGETVQLPVEAIGWAIEIEQDKKEIQRLTNRCDVNSNLLKTAIGTATFGVLPNGEKWSWKLQHRKEYVVKESEFRVLRKLK